MIPARIYDYSHEYHQSFVYKPYLGQKPGKVHQTFEQVLDTARQVHRMTRGLKQIAYLTGWQYDGHDSKYPAWFEVNHRLGNPKDGDARATFLRVIREARERYNAYFSVHINMDDAYETSPLWDDYVAHDLLLKDAAGTLIKGGIWDGEQSYLISKTREWQLGLAKQRIDQLLALLPLSEVGTVHIDVFQPNPCPAMGVSYEDEVAAMIAILDYFQSFGIDVTKEWFHHDFAGRVPMVYHLNLDENNRLHYPPSVICGGGPGWNQRQTRHYGTAAWAGYFTAPDAGCRYDEAWGISIDNGAPHFGHVERCMAKFYAQTLPWLFLNERRAIRHIHDEDTYAVHFTDDVTTSVRKADRYLTMRQGDRLLLDGTDCCVPAQWRERECIAYSRSGSTRAWALPESWQVSRVQIETIVPDGARQLSELPAPGGRVTLTLQPGEAVWVTPC
jgi:hypothetical protein